MRIASKRVPSRFKQVRPGEWQRPVEKNYFLKCCDCGLVHRMDFRVSRGHAEFRAYRAAAK